MAERTDRRERLRRLATHPALWLGLFVAAAIGAGASFAGCGDWDPSRPFDRNAPDVDRALAMMDAGDFASAEEVLETYLGTGPCSEEGWGRSDRMIEKHAATFDLGLVLFQVAEQFGHRFGDEEADAGPDQEALDEKRKVRVDCALIATKAIANDKSVPLELRARAFYLAGNLEFLRKQYEAAVDAYDDALALIPGVDPEAGTDLIGADAAWNRAIALRRMQEQEDAGPDAEPEEPDAEPEEPDAEPEEPDAGDPDAGDPDAGDPDAGDPDAGPDGGEPDAGDDSDAGPDAGDDPQGQDAGAEQEPPPEEPIDDDDPPPPSSYIDRMLDELEDAPTYQEEEAKKSRGQRAVMEDK